MYLSKSYNLTEWNIILLIKSLACIFGKHSKSGHQAHFHTNLYINVFQYVDHNSERIFVFFITA